MDKGGELWISRGVLWIFQKAKCLNPQMTEVIHGVMPADIHGRLGEATRKDRVIHGFHRAYYYDYIYL